SCHVVGKDRRRGHREIARATQTQPPAVCPLRKARPQGPDVLLARRGELLHHAVHGTVFAAPPAPRSAVRRQRRAGGRTRRRLEPALAVEIFFPARQAPETLAARAAPFIF